MSRIYGIYAILGYLFTGFILLLILYEEEDFNREEGVFRGAFDFFIWEIFWLPILMIVYGGLKIGGRKNVDM